MIKLRTIGEIDRVVNNPVLKSENDVAQYTFLTDDGEVYLIANTLAGDDAYIDDATIASGDFLNGFLVRSIEGQELVADEKHIAYGSNQSYANITAGTTLFTINSNGKLAIASQAPSTGVYFKATGKCRLTGKAVVLKVLVA